MADFLRPQNDVVFKLLFGKAQNADLLIDFLTAVLEPAEPITSVIVQNPEIPKDSIGNKSIVLDVIAKLQNGQLIDIEMQVDHRPSFRSRILFYLCRLHQSQLKPSEDYRKTNPSVCIAVLAYTETEEENFHSVYEVRERHSHKLFANDLTLHLIELPKIQAFLGRQPDSNNDLLVQWSRFFNAQSPNDVKELSMQNPIFRKAKEALEIIQGDPKAQELARMRDDAKIFYEMDMQAYNEQGVAKGRIEGEAKGVHKSILKMHNKGMTAAQISELLDLEVSFVQDIIERQVKGS
jgi:predicted transposase/invertase (TIGR01784 family)